MWKMAGVKRREIADLDAHAFHRELDEVSCPIFIEHPQDAVLLLCSSYERGCRSYICDTSYRNSNCLDQFKKLNPLNSITSDMNLRTEFIEGNESQNLDEININSLGEGIVDSGESFRRRVEFEVDAGNTSNSKSSLKCPFCGGNIVGWEVVEEARRYLNLKKRTCSKESCSYNGNYQELRRHARRVHPMTRPSDIDPSRERAWHRLEHQRGYDDTVSAIRSVMPGAVVVGDYAIEDGDRLAGERENGTGEVSTPWWTTFFRFQMFFSADGVGEPRVWSRHRRLGVALSERRFLWGHSLLGLQDEDDEDDAHILSDVGNDAFPIPRRRRRLTRPRSEEDQS
ncbi:hypothetical protein F3Y22_tig00110548pilonHSYRG00909 [Hibiscus syriacus]|uniref:Uncharacterized protein n=1 Tax=Hibiscus syriacus TaxID=106335 RepID=A0A6A3AE09_HIBSY|nr:uncharacterized protein LOC120130688 [Hibiscus syriacus]KAE8701395.1 hypothetical protein F3Y22_tig00110548pilonHSYRG00909 [Hibiscus syriacus]